jgi:glucosamine 6-phosphate synthetase-like amidotransferase/phosphosugar isomerase protein
MCGLFAGIGKLNSNRMIALGSMNEERGTDSVGLAYLVGKEVRLAKVAERPCVGLNITIRKEVTEAAVSGLFIGHTRAATQGTVNSRNAHPFIDDGIAFAHNGIISNDEIFGKYEVDSESLIHGIKAKDFSKYEGAIALVWIEDGKLKAYRCGNPLYRGRHNGAIYLASDDEYLLSVGCTHVKQLAEGLIYTFDRNFQVKTEKVQRNKTYASAYQSNGYDNMSWQDYLHRRDYTPTSLVPLKHDAKTTWELDQEAAEREAMKEDFRTQSDIQKEDDRGRHMDYCDICGDRGELTEGYCLACIMWMDNNGVNRDNPPEHALKVLR